MRTAVAMAVACITLGGLTVAAESQAAIKKFIQIPPQDLSSALLVLETDRKLELIFVAEDLRDLRTEGIDGELTADEALTLLLKGTGLTYRHVAAQTVTIFPSRSNASEGAEGQPLPTAGSATQFESDATRINEAEQSIAAERSSLWSRLRLAQATSASSEGQASQTTSSGGEGLDEIIVTAQKRMERLQDVPVPVTALNGATLSDNNQLRLQDYYASIPGLSLTMGNRSELNLAIRGVTTGFYLNPTVGVVIDDIPYGSSMAIGGAYSMPDIDPGELARIEVLRGPQGTLYGASSIGGLLKFVTEDPSTAGVSGRLQAGLSSVRNGDGSGYNVRGSINVPLSDTWAVRASAFTRRDAGYVDNVQTGQDGVNRLDTDGARVSALWKPSETLSLKLSALYQNGERAGSPQIHVPDASVPGTAGLGDLQQYALIGTGFYEKKIQAYGATLAMTLGGVELTSLTGYSINESSGSVDIPSFALITLGQFGVAGTAIVEDNRTEKLSQEIRLASAWGTRADWLLGAFFTDEDSSVVSTMWGIDPSTGARAGKWFDNSYPTTFKEYAGFGDLTFHLSDRFDVQLGGRASRNDQTYQQTVIGPYNALTGSVDPKVIPERTTKDDAFTVLLTPQLKLSPDLMLYARVASGYRPGGPNQVPPTTDAPLRYAADTTINYELGVKGSLPGHVLGFDASVYYIDWKDLQVALFDGSFNGFNDNVGAARSQGVELSVESRPRSGLSISAWVAWNDAELTEDFPGASQGVGRSGDRLPYSARVTGNLAIEQTFSLTSATTAFVGGSVSYVGDRQGAFGFATPVRQELPGYAQTDVRAGLKLDSWALNLVMSNVTDRRGVISGGLGSFPTYAFTYIQPRTLALMLAKNF